VTCSLQVCPTASAPRGLNLHVEVHRCLYDTATAASSAIADKPRDAFAQYAMSWTVFPVELFKQLQWPPRRSLCRYSFLLVFHCCYALFCIVVKVLTYHCWAN